MAIPYAKKGDPATYLRVVKRAQKLIRDLATTGLDGPGRTDAVRRIRKVIDDVYSCEPYLPEAREADALMAAMRAAEEKSGELYQGELQGELRGADERAREARIAARERGDYSYQEELKLSQYRPRQGNPVGNGPYTVQYRAGGDVKGGFATLEEAVAFGFRRSTPFDVSVPSGAIAWSWEERPYPFTVQYRDGEAVGGFTNLDEALAFGFRGSTRHPTQDRVFDVSSPSGAIVWSWQERSYPTPSRSRQGNPVGGRAAREAANTYRLNGQGIDLDDFFRDNREGLAPEDIDAIRALRPGEKVLIGGGAGAEATITRGAQKRPWAAWPKPLVRDRFASDHDWHAFRALEEWALRYEQRPRPTHALTVPLVVAVEPVDGRFAVAYAHRGRTPIATFGSYESAVTAAKLATQAAVRQANR